MPVTVSYGSSKVFKSLAVQFHHGALSDEILKEFYETVSKSLHYLTAGFKALRYENHLYYSGFGHVICNRSCI